MKVLAEIVAQVAEVIMVLMAEIVQLHLHQLPELHKILFLLKAAQVKDPTEIELIRLLMMQKCELITILIGV